MFKELLTFITNLSPMAAMFILAVGAITVTILALYTVLVAIKEREEYRR
jgi:hypothetical protein